MREKALASRVRKVLSWDARLPKLPKLPRRWEPPSTPALDGSMEAAREVSGIPLTARAWGGAGPASRPDVLADNCTKGEQLRPTAVSAVDPESGLRPTGGPGAELGIGESRRGGLSSPQDSEPPYSG